MSKQLKYVPILRGRQQELIVLKSFDFGERIFPCIEIIKELDRLPQKLKKISKKPTKPKDPKLFEHVYIPLINNIKAEKVFIDLPVHLKDTANMKPETIDFLRTVVARRDVRTEYMIRLASLSSKVIPVISTYHNRTGEIGSIKLQANELRPHFPILAFRTFQGSFDRDISQIEAIATEKDYVIMDWEDIELDEEDGDQQEIIERLRSLKCTVIIHRNAITKEVTNVSLVNDTIVEKIDNSLQEKFKDFSGSCFSDYSGIKKDGITSGGTISPGFIYYDAVKNQFYGYRSEIKDLVQFELKIVPDIIASNATNRMHLDKLDFLGALNQGWTIIQRISHSIESGRSAAKFKRIGIEHYLHCIKIKIANSDFD